MNNKFIKEAINTSDEDFFSWDIISITPLLKEKFKKGNVEFALSYLNASKSLYKCIREQNHLNSNITLFRVGSIIIPFLFLCRHSIELAIKTALDIRNKTYGNIHNLKSLISKFDNLELDDDYMDLVNILDMIDSQGMWLRYDKDLKSKKDYINKMIHVNSKEIIITTEKFVNFLLKIA